MKHILFLFILLTAGRFPAQLISCEPDRAVWLLKKDSAVYALEIKGQVRPGVSESIILVDQFSLRAQLEDKSPYLKKGSGSPETGILLKQALAASHRLSQEYGVKLKFGMQYIPLSEEKNALLWQVELPDGAGDRVSARMFASVVLGSDVVSFETPRRLDQSAEEINNFLTEMISSVKVAPAAGEPCSGGN